jgi:hypothetical protein
MNDFEQARGTHAAAYTHGDDSVFRLAPAAQEGVTCQARTGQAGYPGSG